MPATAAVKIFTALMQASFENMASLFAFLPYDDTKIAMHRPTKQDEKSEGERIIEKYRPEMNKLTDSERRRLRDKAAALLSRSDTVAPRS